MSQDVPPKAERDVAFLYQRTEDGDGYRMLRARKGRLEAGEVRPVQEGKPLHGGEIVKLRPHEKAPWICDVETACELPGRSESGPAQVATDAYRRNWERIFSRPSEDEKKSLN